MIRPYATMHSSRLLDHLSGLHQTLSHLLQSVPEADCYRRFHPDLPPLAWLFSRCIYLESYWLREVVLGDSDLTERTRHLLAHDVVPDDQLVGQIPQRAHLLNWAQQKQEKNLALLADPEHLPPHSLVASERLLPRIVQQQAVLLEQMLAQLTERQLQLAHDYRVSAPLRASAPSADHAEVQRSQYRIGAKQAPTAIDNELPANVVELDAFRIDQHPVNNGAWLGFIEAGGYSDPSLWSIEGWKWKQQQPNHPHHWRQDASGNWYGVGLNGPADLLADDALVGISQHEAQAYANWVASHGGKFEGAAVQHEYQWEVAVRSKALTNFGNAWEWCSNPFHRYEGYLEPENPEAATQDFDAGHFSLRGGSVHTQTVQRRSSYRNHAAPHHRFLFSGTRLVFPSADTEGEK